MLVATGLHRPNLGAELEELIGDPWVLRTVRVENHYARNQQDHVDLGLTAHGTRVLLDWRFAEADVKIATGLVEPHFMAGYSGGRKLIAPGIAGQETITTFHSARFMGHPRAANCVLEGNPLHREQVAIAGMLGRVLAANVVIDEARRLSFVNFGEVLASHRLAVDHVARYALVPVPRRFKTIVTSAAGYPLDKTDPEGPIRDGVAVRLRRRRGGLAAAGLGHQVVSQQLLQQLINGRGALPCLSSTRSGSVTKTSPSSRTCRSGSAKAKSSAWSAPTARARPRF